MLRVVPVVWGTARLQTGKSAFTPRQTVLLLVMSVLFLLGRQITVVELFMVSRVPVIKLTAIAPATELVTGPAV